MQLIPAKQILSTWSNGERWFGINYGMNIYKGCCHGCIYCDSRSECYNVGNFDVVRGKENALAIIEMELKSKRKKGIVGTGGMSDPYNPFEAEYKLTRGALKLIAKYGFGVGAITKSELVLRDIDLFVKIKEQAPSMVNFTITTYNDNLGKIIESNVTPTSKRFDALKQLSEAGIFTGVLMAPILPFINDTEENIRLITEQAAKCGAKFVIPYFGVTLRQNQRDYFYDQLHKKFPSIKENYIKTFGNRYDCISPNSRRLWKVLVKECQRFGLLYKMPDIIESLNSKYENRQLTFF